MNKQDLLGKILASRQELDLALNKLSDQQKLLVILHGEWSPKDLLGHLGFWENWAVDLFDAIKAGKESGSIQDLDSINAASLTEMRSKNLREVESYEMNAYKRIFELINKASEAELFDTGYFKRTKDTSFQEIISDNTWGHYEEHLAELNAWLKRIA